MRYKRASFSRRRGTVTVEMALVLPVLFALIFSGIEISRANVLWASCENAAFEGARRGIVPGATAAACQSAAESVLNVANIPNRTITVTPSVIVDTTPSVTVKVEIPMTAANNFFAPQWFAGKKIEKSFTLQRETQ